MKINSRVLIAFTVIMFLWLAGSHEMYLNKILLTNAVSSRYIIYSLWIALVCFTGYLAFRNSPQQWLSKVWLSTYFSGFIVFLLLGCIDLFIFHFSRDQKVFIQTFRLFLESPAPFVILFLVQRMVSVEAPPVKVKGD